MTFACIHIPNLPVQAVVRHEPELRFRAVVIIDGKAEAVVAANAAARQAGVQLGMIKLQVAQLPAIEIRPRSRAQEEVAHAALLDLGFVFSPRVEDTAADAMTLDLEGLERVWGSPENIARKIVQQAAGLGLNVRVAVARNPDAALHAARGFAGITVIESDGTAERLGPLPVSILAPADEILETLNRWGIRTFKGLASLSTAELSERLGQPGVQLQKLARGAWLRPLIPVQPSLHFEEVMELEYAEEELEPLSFILGRMLGQLCARLTARGLAVNELRLGLDLVPGEEQGVAEKQGIGSRELEVADNDKRLHPSRLPTPDSPLPSCHLPLTTSHCSLRLPVPIHDSKVLLKLLQLNLSAHPPPAPIRRITITAEPAKPRIAQGGLFAPIAPDPARLEITLARIGAVIGAGNLGSPELPDTHRPAAFGMSKFNPLSAGSASAERTRKQSRFGKMSDVTPSPLAPRPLAGRGWSRDAGPGEGGLHFANIANTNPKAAIRMFRTPVPATVETREGFPVRVFFSGITGQVISVAGPWRSSGDWWTEDSWQQDEWDVEIRMSQSNHRQGRGGWQGARGKWQESVLYRIYRDTANGQWFVRGAYD
jgi:protein ImuB